MLTPSELCYFAPNPDLPPIPVADMLSTDHTQPSIIHFLETFKRATKEKVKSFQPRKIELDWSWPLINSCMKTFNEVNVKHYLNIAWDIVHSKYNRDEMKDFSIIHICVSHMTKTFAQKANKISGKNTDLFYFIMKAFVLLSNETNFNALKHDLENIMTVLLSPNTAYIVKTAEQCVKNTKLDRLKLDLALQEEDKDDKEDNEESITQDESIDDYMDNDRQTIGEASPWLKMAKMIQKDLTDLIKENSNEVNSEKKESNPLYCPAAVDMIVNNFMYIYPMWSGLLLGSLHRYDKDSRYLEEETCVRETRDSNAYAESWFSILKKGIFRGKTRLEPSAFIAELKRQINARIKEVYFPDIRKGRRRIINKNESMIEEKWSRKGKSKKNCNRHQPVKPQVKIKSKENTKPLEKLIETEKRDKIL